MAITANDAIVAENLSWPAFSQPPD